MSEEIRVQGLTTLSGEPSKDPSNLDSPKWDMTPVTLFARRQNNDDNLVLPPVLDFSSGHVDDKGDFDSEDN